MGPVIRALSAGYTPLAIVQFMAQVMPKFGRVVEKANDAGYSSSQILDVLNNVMREPVSTWEGTSGMEAKKVRDASIVGRKIAGNAAKLGAGLIASLAVAPILSGMLSGSQVASQPNQITPSSTAPLPQVPPGPPPIPPQSPQTGAAPQPPIGGAQTPGVPSSGGHGTPPLPVNPMAMDQKPLVPEDIEQKKAYEMISSSMFGDKFKNLSDRVGPKDTADTLKWMLGDSARKHVRDFEKTSGKSWDQLIADAHAYHQQTRQQPVAQPQQIAQQSPNGGQMAQSIAQPLPEIAHPTAQETPSIKGKSALPTAALAHETAETPSAESTEQTLTPIANVPKTKHWEGKPEKGSKVFTSSGSEGTVDRINDDGSLVVDVNGKKKKMSADEVGTISEEFIDTVDSMLSQIPEDEKSAALSFASFVPDFTLGEEKAPMMALQFHDGSLYLYPHASMEDFEAITGQKYTAKTSGENAYHEWVQGESSRGGSFAVIKKHLEEKFGKNYVKLPPHYDQMAKVRHAAKILSARLRKKR